MLEFLNADTSVAELCRQHNISPAAFQDWKDKFMAGGKQALAGRVDMATIHTKEAESLKRIICEITVANDILKRAHIGSPFFIILVFCYSMSRDNKIILSIAVFVLVVLATVFVIIPAYLLRQSVIFPPLHTTAHLK